MRLYRCYNPKCAPDAPKPGFDFTADKPLCPRCGSGGDGPGKRFAHLIAPLVVLHYEPPHPAVAEAGTGELACAPGKPRPPATRVTGVPEHVNCPACRASAVWKERSAAWAAAPEYELPPNGRLDFPITIDPGKQIITTEEG